MVLDDDEADTGDTAEGACDIETGCAERDASPHDILATLELASAPTKSLDAVGPWYDVEEGRYIDDPALRLGSCEQQGVPSAPAQDQLQILSPPSNPLQDQIN